MIASSHEVIIEPSKKRVSVCHDGYSLFHVSLPFFDEAFMVFRFFIVIDADEDDFSAIVQKRPGIVFFLNLTDSRLSVMTPFIINSKINIGN